MRENILFFKEDQKLLELVSFYGTITNYVFYIHNTGEEKY